MSKTNNERLQEIAEGMQNLNERLVYVGGAMAGSMVIVWLRMILIPNMNDALILFARQYQIVKRKLKLYWHTMYQRKNVQPKNFSEVQ